MNKLQQLITRITILNMFVITLILSFSSPAWAETDFTGETITWIVPFKEGGGNDKLARFYAPLLSKTLPGQPIVVVKNMPGAGSTKGANWFASNAKSNGLTLLITSASTQFPFLLDDSRVKFNYAKWQAILASSTGGVVYLPPELGEQWKKDPKSILDTRFIYGSQGATRIDLVPLLAWEILGLKVDPVFGLKGRSDGRLMFERGEANIDFQTSPAFLSQVTPLVEEGKAVPIMTLGVLDDDGNIVRDPNFPDLPTFKEVYQQIKGEEPSGAAWNAWKAFFIAGFPTQKLVLLPKDTDQAIIDTYDKAFKTIISDPNFVQTSTQVLGTYPQTTGKKAAQFKEMGTTIDAESKQWMKDWLKNRYGIALK